MKNNIPKFSVKAIANAIECQFKGQTDCSVTGFSDIENAGLSDMVFAIDSNVLDKAILSRASIILGPGKILCEMEPSNTRAFILSNNPYADYARVIAHFFVNPASTDYTKMNSDYSRCHVHSTAKLGENVRIMPGVVIGPGVSIGNNTVIYPNTTILDYSIIGSDSLIYSNVTIREKVYLGNRVIIQAGSVIGGDGFGFAPDGKKYIKIPQIGGVLIEDDVEIGSNVTIDRGAIRNTFIGRGTKIDNLVHIAHNCEIGEDCVIVAMAGVSGSVKIGNHCTLAGQTGIVGHVTIGPDTVVAARGVVTSDIAGHTMVSGFPARLHSREKRIKAALNRLPEMVKFVKKLMDTSKKSSD